MTIAEPSIVAAQKQDPQQNFGTAGIKPLERPSLLARAFMAVVAFVERLNPTCSKVGNPPIYDNAVFPWKAAIEREWRAIRAELDRVLTRKDDLPGFHELSTDVATISQIAAGKRFSLRLRLPLRQQYQAVSANLAYLPEHPRPDHGDVLDPGAGQASPAHRGPYNGVLRLHLGLIVPEPREQLGIRVEQHSTAGRKAKRWCSTTPMSTRPGTRRRIPAWCCSSISASRCACPPIFQLAAAHLAVFTPFIREGMDNQKAWEKKFYERPRPGGIDRSAALRSRTFAASSLPTCSIPTTNRPRPR